MTVAWPGSTNILAIRQSGGYRSDTMSNNTPDKLFSMTPKEILSFIDKRCGNLPEQVPPGWYSVFTLAKEWNLSEQHTGKRLQSAVREGLMEKKSFRIATSGTAVRPVAHYRVVVKA